VKITLKDSALEGFTKVYRTLAAHAVAVVDPEVCADVIISAFKASTHVHYDHQTGKLVANLSASDLRGITAETIGSLLSPVEGNFSSIT